MPCKDEDMREVHEPKSFCTDETSLNQYLKSSSKLPEKVCVCFIIFYRIYSISLEHKYIF